MLIQAYSVQNEILECVQMHIHIRALTQTQKKRVALALLIRYCEPLTVQMEVIGKIKLGEKLRYIYKISRQKRAIFMDASSELYGLISVQFDLLVRHGKFSALII